jgi:broad specificity phosphatase PhoE
VGPLEGEPLVLALRQGGYVIFFRHAATDQVIDDAYTIDLTNCATQRNLSSAGRSQARLIGQAIERLEIPIGQVLSSPFCRTLDTARLAFGEATIEPGLENLETSESQVVREARIEALRGLLAAPPDGGTNTVLVSHGFNISAAAQVSLVEGEAAIFRPEGEGDFTMVATVAPDEWEGLLAQP